MDVLGQILPFFYTSKALSEWKKSFACLRNTGSIVTLQRPYVIIVLDLLCFFLYLLWAILFLLSLWVSYLM